MNALDKAIAAVAPYHRLDGRESISEIHLAEVTTELINAVTRALHEMDRSMYGDPEVPFRMRQALMNTESVL